MFFFFFLFPHPLTTFRGSDDGFISFYGVINGRLKQKEGILVASAVKKCSNFTLNGMPSDDKSTCVWRQESLSLTSAVTVLI